jgi:hypothetical protein
MTLLRGAHAVRVQRRRLRLGRARQKRLQMCFNTLANPLFSGEISPA